jgi:hypothetical protein
MKKAQLKLLLDVLTGLTKAVDEVATEAKSEAAQHTIYHVKRDLKALKDSVWFAQYD